MKYRKGDCFKRMPEVTDGWNEYNLTTTIMIYDIVDGYYKVYSDTDISFGIIEEEIDKYFYRLYTREEYNTIVNFYDNLP